MDLNLMLASAISLTATSFYNKLDKGGEPYILHCLKVMHNLNSTDRELQCIAVMHDLIEDTDVSYHELREMGYTSRIIEGVRCMTKIRGQTPQEYFEQVVSNRDSILVKLADLRHNSDIRRLKGVTEKDFQRIQKYQLMYTKLLEYL